MLIESQRLSWQRLRVVLLVTLAVCLSPGPSARSAPEEDPVTAEESSNPTPGPIKTSRPPLIQVLQSADQTPYREALQGFRRALKEQNGPEGEAFNLRVHLLKAARANEENVPGHQKADLVFSLGTSATQVAKRIAGRRPVVFSMVVNPIAQGLYEPDGTEPLTGVTMDVSFEDQFDALKRVLPRATRVGVLHQASNTPLVERARRAASKRGLKLVGVPVKSSDQIPAALEQLTGKIDALWSFADSMTYSPALAQFLILHMLRTGVPFMGVSPGFVKAGALFCVYANYEDIGSQSAGIVGRILSGEEIENIPIQSPQRPRLALNLVAAEAIGQVIPLEVRKKADLRF